MFSEHDPNECRILPSKRDRNGAYLIDRSPTYFEPLLNYLRHGQLIIDPVMNPAGNKEDKFFFWCYLKFIYFTQ